MYNKAVNYGHTISFQIPILPNYSLSNPPRLDAIGWVIEQLFLRHIKTGVIPHLEQYLKQLNDADWTCLLAENPRPEFFKYLSHAMRVRLDWEYIRLRELDRKRSR